MRSTLILLLFAAPAAAGDRETVEVRLERAISAELRPRILFPRARLSLLARRPKGFQGLPGVSKQGLFAVAQLGRRKLRLAFDVLEGTSALGLLYAGGKPATGRIRAAGKDGFAVEFTAVECAGLACNVRLNYRGPRPRSGWIQPTYHRRGKAVLDGVVREVVLVDADADGRYDGARDRWIAPRADKSASLKTVTAPTAQLLAEPQIPFQANGLALSIESVAPDGSRLLLVLDKPAIPLRKVLSRRYAEVRAAHYEVFEREMADFVLDQKLDMHRTRVETAASWRSLSLSDARKIAARQGKPLLIEFFTESNPWSYRYAFYSYPDAEVDSLLRRFVLVRIDAEKDAEKSYQTLSARGLPALLPLTASGKAVSFTFRSRGKDGKVRDLAREENMITGWQRPTELAVNLKRILKACAAR